MIEPALALIDFSSIAAGIEAADAMAKRAQIDVIRAARQPGRYLR
jgi:microcompartment protein CcmL/EutN